MVYNEYHYKKLHILCFVTLQNKDKSYVSLKHRNEKKIAQKKKN